MSSSPPKLPKPPTIADVARLSGLSKATVSKSLNLPPDQCPLRFETQQRVLDVARKLGYRPNWRAQALANQATNTIGLLYRPPTPPMSGVYEEIFGAFTEGMTAAGYHLLYVPVSPQNEDWSQILLSHRLDGCVVFEMMPEPAESVLVQSKLPAVVVNADTSLPLPRIMPDDRGGAIQATRHLIELGHRRICFFHGPESVRHCSVNDRIAGYREAMRAAGLSSDISVIGSEVEAFVQNHMEGEDRPTAVLSYIHYFAIDMLRALTSRNIRVPEQVSLVTFNDVYPVAQLYPSITAMGLPATWMGRMASQLLLQQIREEVPVDNQTVTLQEKLVVRESSAPPPRTSHAADTAQPDSHASV